MPNKYTSDDKVIEMDQYLQERLEKECWIRDLSETYFMCRQLNHGDVGLQSKLKTSFETMYNHVYVSQGGCPWCQKRIALKKKYRLSQQKYNPKRQYKLETTKIVSLS